MNFIKRIFTKKKLNNISNAKLLKRIFKTQSYKDGYTCFQFASRNFFSLVDNSGKIKKSEYGDKIIAVCDFNGDREPYETLFYSNMSDEVRIRFFGEKSFKISNSLYDLFNRNNPEESFVKRNDPEYWAWSEQMGNSSEIQNKVHKCAFPQLNLVSEVKTKFNAFVSSSHEFNLDAFSNFFLEYGNVLTDLIPLNFAVFNGFDTNLITLISDMNIASKENKFKIIEFYTFGFWGIIELNGMEKHELELLERYGLMAENH